MPCQNYAKTSGLQVKVQGHSNALNFTDYLFLFVGGKKKEGCNDRFLETADQNLFILGGYIAESDVLQISENQVKGEGQGHSVH